MSTEEMLEWLKQETDEPDEAVLKRCLHQAYAAIQRRRFPGRDEWPDEVEPRYRDTQYSIALAIYNKRGAEDEIAHTENGISRSYESSWVPEQLLREVIPMCEVL